MKVTFEKGLLSLIESKFLMWVNLRKL